MPSNKSQHGGWTRKLVTATAFAAIVGVALQGLPACATQFSTDNSDLWWNPNESGWGLQLVQRSEAIFATLFVYDNAGAPVWYAATLEPNGRVPSWTGSLTQCNGPWFGTVPFDPRLASCTQVGTMTFTALGVQVGMLVYSVNGVTVNKIITRETLRMQDSSGTYVGILSSQAPGCPDPAIRRSQKRVDFNLVQTATTLSMVTQDEGSSAVCTSSGAYTQSGQFGSGTQVISSCSDGSKAPGDALILEQVVVSATGVTMNFTAASSNLGQQGCTVTGSIYGIRQ